MKKLVFAVVGVILIILALTYISVSSTDKEFDTCKIMGWGDLESIDFRKHDSVLIAASTLYEGNELKELMQGEQYREAWSTPIKVAIVFLDTLMGGMKVMEEGGGKQTHSLELEAPDGTKFSLRSITKDPKVLVPGIARALGLENIVIDGISAQHPYAAIVVSKLAQAAEILHTEPQVVFIPEQPTLGKHNQKYGNRLFLLEHETEGGSNWTKYKDVVDIIDTDNLQKLKKEHGNKVVLDKKALVRARLFDILIGDWDRHAKQWGWVVLKEEDTFMAIPIPGDRDNAFFNLEGIIPSLISDENIMPELRPFKKEIDYLPGLVQPFDVYFLKTVPEPIFLQEAAKLQELLSDTAISDALAVWSGDIYNLHGQEIETKLKQRRDDLLEYAKGFYQVLSERQLLTEPLKGSEKLELPKDLMACFECF